MNHTFILNLRTLNGLYACYFGNAIWIHVHLNQQLSILLRGGIRRRWSMLLVRVTLCLFLYCNFTFFHTTAFVLLLPFQPFPSPICFFSILRIIRVFASPSRSYGLKMFTSHAMKKLFDRTAFKIRRNTGNRVVPCVSLLLSIATFILTVLVVMPGTPSGRLETFHLLTVSLELLRQGSKC